MNAQQVKNILVDALGEENTLSMIPCSGCVFEADQVSLSQFHDIELEIENYFIDYMQGDNIDQSKVEILQKVIQDLRNLETQRKEQEKGKTMLVCNSEIFKKNEKITSKWHPSCLVSLNVSFTKSFEIAPDIKDEEPNHSVLNMIHKWKGMKSNCAPIVIPIENKEMEQFILGSLVMFSIYDSSRCKFPIVLDGPDSCRRLLQIREGEDWAEMGQLILNSFDINTMIEVIVVFMFNAVFE